MVQQWLITKQKKRSNTELTYIGVGLSSLSQMAQQWLITKQKKGSNTELTNIGVET